MFLSLATGLNWLEPGSSFPAPVVYSVTVERLTHMYGTVADVDATTAHPALPVAVVLMP